MDFLTLWTLISLSLVFFMQAGFSCLEAGLIRSKNSTNVAVKNITDFVISFTLFWLFGYAFMFGQSQGGFIGSDLFAPGFNDFSSLNLSSTFLFQAVFCSAAVTIFSGAVAERIAFRGFIALAFFIAAFIYPIVGHWLWNDNGWLNALGAYDFAGTVVIHCVGGWIALAAVMVIGPRMGRFSANGKPIEIPPFSLTLSALGVLILCFGWIGFNGGSASSANAIGYIILNTFIGGIFAALGILLFSLWQKKVVNVGTLANGLLAGLVSVTGCAEIIVTWQAALIGLIGGGVMCWTSQLLLKFQIDDAIDAIPVHLGAGIWGTLAVAFFGDLNQLNMDSRVILFGVQALAIFASGLWAFGLTYLFAKLASRFIAFRVSERDEILGLNISEHGQVDPLRDLIDTMQHHAETGDMSKRVYAEPFTESEEIAHFYNKALDTIQNITDNLEQTVKQRTEQLEDETKKALHASQAKSMFLANMSHELRTPLNSIIGMTSMTLEMDIDDEQKEMISTAHQASKILLEIVNDILDLSKIESGELDLERIGFDFVNVLNRVIATLKPLASQKGNVLSTDIDKIALPYIIGDPIRVGGILTNLIGNALKYTSDGSVTVKIITKEIKENDEIIIRSEVIDTGIGIPHNRQAAIFEKFSQAESSTTRKFGGTGLGLSITKQLVEMMGGKIGLTSIEGEGSTFWFEIPFETTNKLNDELKESKADISFHAETSDTHIAQDDVRILIAEDHELNTIFLKKLMKKWQLHNTTFVINGLEAIKSAKTGDFDIILMDCHMPEMNGYDATKAIRSLDDESVKNIPIIALTADAIKGTKEQCLEAGMNAYTTKPIDQKHLKSILKNWIDFTAEE